MLGLINSDILLILGIISGLFMSFNIGANDIANAMGATLGCKALKMWQIIIVAGFFELLGSVLLGGFVAQTVSTGLIGIDTTNVTDFITREFMLAMLSTLIGSGIWLIIATMLALPVSTTHSVVGSVIFLGICMNGPGSIDYNNLGKIAMSWVLSPAIGGGVSFIFWYILKRFVVETKTNDDYTQLVRILMAFPVLVSLTVGILILFLLYKGLKVFHLEVDFLVASSGAAIVSLLVGIIAILWLVPFLKWKISKEFEKYIKKKVSKQKKVIGILNQDQQNEAAKQIEDAIKNESQNLPNGIYSSAIKAEFVKKEDKKKQQQTKTHNNNNNNNNNDNENDVDSIHSNDDEINLNSEHSDISDHEEEQQHQSGSDDENEPFQPESNKNKQKTETIETEKIEVLENNVNNDNNPQPQISELEDKPLGFFESNNNLKEIEINNDNNNNNDNDDIDDEDFEKQIQKTIGDENQEIEEVVDVVVEEKQNNDDGDQKKIGQFGQLLNQRNRIFKLIRLRRRKKKKTEDDRISEFEKKRRIAEKETFNLLVIATSCAIATAHGSNDIGNAAGPLAGVGLSYVLGTVPTGKNSVPLWVTLVAAGGLVFGLAILGYKVMATIGSKITKLSPARAFVAQLSSSFVTLTASLLGLPLSTTHIIVGSVFGISLVDMKKLADLNFIVFIRIIISWVITIPAAGIFSIASFYSLRWLL